MSAETTFPVIEAWASPVGYRITFGRDKRRARCLLYADRVVDDGDHWQFFRGIDFIGLVPKKYARMESIPAWVDRIKPNFSNRVTEILKREPIEVRR
jgi:hypothetical protein